MACSVSFKELVNLAIGSPELGAVNFNALHSLLHGLLEQLQLGEVRRDLSPEEGDFIKPGLPKGGTDDHSGRSSSLFHQLQDRMGKMEARLRCLDSLPSSSTLLQGSQSQNKPVQEMWQLMQLKKKVEVNEDGVNKVMSTFQELLSTFNSLKLTTDMIKDSLGTLGDTVRNFNIQEIQQRLQDMERETLNIPILGDKVVTLQNKLASYPEATDLVTWPSLHDAVNTKTSDHAMNNNLKEKNAKSILGTLGHLPGRHEELAVKVQGIEEELRRMDKEISEMGIPEDLLEQLQRVREDVDKIVTENKKEKDEFGILKKSLHQLKKDLQQLDSKTNKLEENLVETMTLKSLIDELERKKLDREELMLELNAKADKRVVDTKVGHDQLEATMSEVNAVLEELIRKLALQEDEWRSTLEKLLTGLEAKLGHSDLDSIHRDLEELWRILKKNLSAANSFDPDAAAGFRKKLFERVSCISCDRPVTMATGPHLVTIRSATLQPRNRPNSAEPNDKGEKLDSTDAEFQYCEAIRPHTACPNYKKPSRTKNLTTVYPYGNPNQVQYKHNEVDLMGIDGVMYKGRLDKNPHISERDPTVVMIPQHPYRTPLERARSATCYRAPSSLIAGSPSTRNSQTLLHVPSATETPSLHQQQPSNERLSPVP